MERLKNLWRIIKKCHLEKIFIFYFICFYASSFIVWRVDPAFDTFNDATWYFFVASTSIGFGDETVTTTIGRILTVFITYYQLFLFAALSGVLVSHYLSILQQKEKMDAIKDRLQNKTTGEVVEQLSVAINKISNRLSYISSVVDGKNASSSAPDDATNASSISTPAGKNSSSINDATGTSTSSTGLATGTSTSSTGLAAGTNTSSTGLAAGTSTSSTGLASVTKDPSIDTAAVKSDSSLDDATEKNTSSIDAAATTDPSIDDDTDKNTASINIANGKNALSFDTADSNLLEKLDAAPLLSAAFSDTQADFPYLFENLYKLQHLTDLSPKELEELQEKFKILK